MMLDREYSSCEEFLRKVMELGVFLSGAMTKDSDGISQRRERIQRFGRSN